MPASPRDSYAPLTSTMIFVASDGTRTPIPTDQYLMGIDIEQFSEGGWKGRVELFDQDGEFLENLLIGGGPKATLEFRYGYADDPLPLRPLHVGSIILPEPSFTPQGVTYGLNLVCRQNLEAVLDKQSRFYPAGMTATAIFKDIAAKRGWKTIDRNGNSSVQESAGTLESFSTTGESDIAFLRTKILTRCHDSAMVGFVFFFDIDNVVHWHSINYAQSVGGAPTQFAKEYQFARDMAGEVLSFKPKDNVIATALKGAGNAKYPSLDSLAGVATEKNVDKNAGPDGSKLTGVQGAVYKSPLPDTLHARIQVTSRDSAELDHMVAAGYSRLAIQTYTAEAEVMGTHAVRPWDYISMRWVKKNGLDHYLSGAFLVTKVHQHFSTAGFLTNFDMARMGHGYTQGADKLDVKRNAVITPGSGVPGSSQASTVKPGGSTPRRPGE